jgi:glycerophosphoryl diester phosphodiesterase
VNDPAAMREMLELGVDGVMTDRPRLLRDVLAGRGVSVPAPPARS